MSVTRPAGRAARRAADSRTLHATARAEGPVLLIAVALGLIAFGLYSWCEARWRRV